MSTEKYSLYMEHNMPLATIGVFCEQYSFGIQVHAINRQHPFIEITGWSILMIETE